MPITETKSYEIGIDSLVRRHAQTSPTPSGADSFVAGTVTSLQNFVTREVRPKGFNWRREIREGRSATTYMTGVKYRYDWKHDGIVEVLDEEYTAGKKTGHLYYRVNGALWGLTDTFNPALYLQSEARANNQALIRLHENISEAYRDLQGSVALGELSESLRMIRSPAKALREGIAGYLGDVKKRFSGRRRTTQPMAASMIADTWLEYAFGWKPLISDIDDGMKALANALNYHPERLVVRGKGIDVWQGEFSASGNFLHGNIIVTRNKLIRTGTVEVWYHGSVGITRPGSSEQTDFRRFGLGIDQFLPTIWELIPYSFVVDYFTNIGGILTAYSNTLSTNMLWLEKNVRLTLHSKWKDVVVSYQPVAAGFQRVHKYSSPGLQGGLSKTSFTREVWSLDATVPSLELSVPGMSTKWINLSALFLASKQAHQSVRNGIRF